MSYPKTKLMIVLTVLFMLGNYMTIQPTHLENSIMGQGFFPVHQYCDGCRIYSDDGGTITVFSTGRVQFDLELTQTNVLRLGQILSDSYPQTIAIDKLADFETQLGENDN